MREGNQCPLCEASLPSMGGVEKHIDAGTTYTLYECEHCGVAFWTPLKNPGGEWYEHDERYAGANKNPPRDPNYNHRLTISLLTGKKGRVLDIGCGTGNFLSHAMKRGWIPYGIDFDANAVRAATDVFLLPNIELASLEDFVKNHTELHGTFDLITFFDVFEHLDAHRLFAELVADLLTPDGYIAMSMPYRHGARWLQPNDLPPRHLTRWDEHSLTSFWRRNGFTQVSVRRVPVPFSALLMKFRFRYGKAFSFGLITKVETSAKKSTIGTQATIGIPSIQYRLLLLAARTKDLLLFGIPAGFSWLYLLGRRERYTGLYALLRKDHHE